MREDSTRDDGRSDPLPISQHVELLLQDIDNMANDRTATAVRDPSKQQHAKEKSREYIKKRCLENVRYVLKTTRWSKDKVVDLWKASTGKKDTRAIDGLLENGHATSSQPSKFFCEMFGIDREKDLFESDLQETWSPPNEIPAIHVDSDPELMLARQTLERLAQRGLTTKVRKILEALDDG